MSTASKPSSLDSTLLKVVVVVVVGSVMTTLDMTVVNVALQPLTLRFQTSLDTIQWVATGYLLALGMAIPVTGWAGDRFGTKRLFMLSIVLFVLGSALAGAAWDVGSLIIFRVVQGLGGGILMPAGLTIVTRAAGPHRIGRVMAGLGVPLLLGPIAGPVLGGWLVDVAGWRWLFFVNAPIGVVAVLLAWRFLPGDEPRPAERFDFPGMLMLSPGLAALIYGISTIPHRGGITATSVWLPVVLGLVLIAGFLVRAAKIANPLVDLSLFRDRAFRTAMGTLSLFQISFLGTMMVVPTYFMLVRGESALTAGLMVAPQGVGALLTMPVAGRLVDRVGPRKVVLPGLVLIAVSFALLTQVGADTPYWTLLLTVFVTGLGMGMTLMPINSAALQMVPPALASRASTLLNIVLQTAGAIGAAVVSIILASRLADRFGVPASAGQLTATTALADPATHEAAAAASGGAFASTFAWTLLLVLLCLLPAAFLPNRAAPPSQDRDPAAAVHR